MSIDDWVKNLYEEVDNKHCDRKMIAHSYSILLHLDTGDIRWGEINKKILTRYAQSGLIFIKELAWKIARGEVLIEDLHPMPTIPQPHVFSDEPVPF